MVTFKGFEEIKEAKNKNEFEKYPGVISAEDVITFYDGHGRRIDYKGIDGKTKRIVETATHLRIEDITDVLAKKELDLDLNSQKTFERLTYGLPAGTITIDGKKVNIINAREFAESAYGEFSKQPWVDESGKIVDEPLV